MISPGSAGIEVARLEHRPDLASRLIEIGVAAAKDERSPGCRPCEPEQKAQRRRLARAIGPEKPCDRSRLQGESQVFDGHYIAIAFG